MRPSPKRRSSRYLTGSGQPFSDDKAADYVLDFFRVFRLGIGPSQSPIPRSVPPGRACVLSCATRDMQTKNLPILIHMDLENKTLSLIAARKSGLRDNPMPQNNQPRRGRPPRNSGLQALRATRHSSDVTPRPCTKLVRRVQTDDVIVSTRA